MRGASIMDEFTSGAAHPVHKKSVTKNEENFLKEMKQMGVQIERACTEEIRAQSLSVVRDMRRELQALIRDAVHSSPYVQRQVPPSDWSRSELDPRSGAEHLAMCTPPQPPPMLPVGVDPPSGNPMRCPPRHVFSSALNECDDAFVQPPVPGVSEMPRSILPNQMPKPPELPDKPWQVQEAAVLRSRGFEGQADAAAGGTRSELEKAQDPDETTDSEHDGREGKPKLTTEKTTGDLSGMTRGFSSIMQTSTRKGGPGGRATCRRLSLGMHRSRRMSQRMMRLKTKPFYQMTARELLASTKFDNMTGCFILLNAATIGWQSDYAARHLTDTFPDYFVNIERVFCAIFTLELILRMYVQRLQFWCGARKNIVWNYFDLLVVLAQLLEEVITIAASSNGIELAKFRLLRVLRILRLIRILRVVRVLHLISELRTIISSILGSVRSLAWTVVLLSLIIYIVGVYFTNQITDYLVDKKLSNDIATKGDNDLSYYFGSLGRALLSLWQAMSGGADWDDIAGPLIDVHPLLGVAFAMFIAFALLALMNVVTGVFVQTALQNAKEEEDLFLEDQIVKLFEIQDREKRTSITLAEIEARLGNPETAMDWKAINVHVTEARYLFDLLDTDETGEIGFEEFLSGCLRLHGTAKSFDLLTVMQEQRALVKSLNSQKMELHEQMGDLSQQVLTTVHLTTVCSTCIDKVMDMLRFSHDSMLLLERQVQQQESVFSMMKHLGTSVNNLQNFLNTVAGLPAGGFPTKSTPKGCAQSSRSVKAGVANEPVAPAVASLAAVPPIDLDSDLEEEV